jgi:hypothetical protein
MGVHNQNILLKERKYCVLIGWITIHPYTKVQLLYELTWKQMEMFYKSFLGLFAKLRKATVIFVTSIRPSAKKNSDPTTWVFMKFDISVFLENLSRNFKIR